VILCQPAEQVLEFGIGEVDHARPAGSMRANTSISVNWR
jgi:hypothetical protein